MRLDTLLHFGAPCAPLKPERGRDALDTLQARLEEVAAILVIQEVLHSEASAWLRALRRVVVVEQLD